MNACIDQHTGFVVSYELGDHRDTELAIKTIKKANKKLGLANSIVHSDRAKSYDSMEYINYCKEKNIVQSMNDRPISTQNLPIEKFFDIFKNEFLKKIAVGLRSKIHLKNEIDLFIDHYNYSRIQKRKNWRKYSTPSSVLNLYLNQ